jgi:proline iminopeptidase
MAMSEGHVTTDDGVRLFYRKVGSGPRAVLIPNGFYLFEDFEYLGKERTLVFFDLRNRGRSDQVSDGSRLARGIHHDVDDMDTIRRHLGFERVGAIGHSYVGMTVVLYAVKYPDAVDRLVQIGAIAPSQSKVYPPHLTNVDTTLRDTLARLAELEKERQLLDPKQLCQKFWSVLAPIYVADPADAHKIKWSRCDLPNELNFMKYWLEHLLPSIQKVNFTAEEAARVQSPVLTVHGTKDRSAPYGGGRDWASMLPNARLLTVEHAAHAPWIEAPELVFSSIRTFLDGEWPEAAETAR